MCARVVINLCTKEFRESAADVSERMSLVGRNGNKENTHYSLGSGAVLLESVRAFERARARVCERTCSIFMIHTVFVNTYEMGGACSREWVGASG